MNIPSQWSTTLKEEVDKEVLINWLLKAILINSQLLNNLKTNVPKLIQMQKKNQRGKEMPCFVVLELMMLGIKTKLEREIVKIMETL